MAQRKRKTRRKPGRRKGFRHSAATKAKIARGVRRARSHGKKRHGAVRRRRTVTRRRAPSRRRRYRTVSGVRQHRGIIGGWHAPASKCGRCRRVIFGGAKGMTTHNRRHHRR